MFNSKPGAAPMSGPEMMMRNMGLGSVLDAAKQLAESGAAQKIIAFAEDMEGLKRDIATINAAQRAICAHFGIGLGTGGPEHRALAGPVGGDGGGPVAGSDQSGLDVLGERRTA